MKELGQFFNSGQVKAVFRPERSSKPLGRVPLTNDYPLASTPSNAHVDIYIEQGLSVAVVLWGQRPLVTHLKHGK
jgi:hypothetical protein